ncbi:hypothetical protein PV327_001567 [Microctonus hyperodae]|uniref:Uncharacterized protein n=1 Tax=Microctonus hyperodae TaxID=165561 RepID=A0AA39G9I8_MICHY|nr:hypothetical protein PV327_001567 [Microctonus hyperodae]
MTNGGEYDHKSEDYVELDGLSLYIDELFKYKIKNEEIILSATITDYGYFHNYPTVAHELGHLMSLEHDDPPYFTCDAKCCGHLLKTFSEYCNECLSWSETSETTFELFYKSPNCCSFVNKPRSLLPAGRHLMLTAVEQCQCYGYENSLKFRELRMEFCYTNLYCRGIDNKYYRAVVPMDGTPQGSNNKVCWDKMSQPIEVF